MTAIQEAAHNSAAAAVATASNTRADAGLFAQELEAQLETGAVSANRRILAAAMERLASSFPGVTVTGNAISGFGEAREYYLRTGDAASINVGPDMLSQMAGDDDVFERVKGMISTLLTAGRQQNLVNAGGSGIHRNVNIQTEEVRYVEVQRTTAGSQLSVASFAMEAKSLSFKQQGTLLDTLVPRDESAVSGLAPSSRNANSGFKGLMRGAASWRVEGILSVRSLTAMNGRVPESGGIQGEMIAVSAEAIIQQWSTSSASSGSSGNDLLAYMQLMGLSDPLVLDLGDEGINLTSPEDGVYFDIKGDGSPTRTAFIRGDNALLYLDRNGNGAVDDVGELFGDHGGHANGYEALAQYDDNGDRTIDANDAVFDRLRVWRDRNSDGITQEKESMTLAEAGIASLSLNHDNHRELDRHGNVISDRSSFTRADGSAGLMAEAWFRTL